MKRGCLVSLVAIATIYILATIWDRYTSRPEALYERWFGSPVPADVAHLDGLSQFAITESSNWLTFTTSQQRIDAIVANRGMTRISPEDGWRDTKDTQEIVVAGRTYNTNWFHQGVLRFRENASEIQVYWRGHRSEDILAGGYALYYVPSSGHAYYTSISM